MAKFSTLEDLTPLEVEILRRTANLGIISYDATPTCDVDDSGASELCSGSEDDETQAFSGVLHFAVRASRNQTNVWHRSVTSGCVKYPVTVAVDDRTEASMLSDMTSAAATSHAVNGVKEPSPLINVQGFDIVWNFRPDYMHCVLLGVVQQVTEIWFSNVGEDHYIGAPRTLAGVDQRLQGCDLEPCAASEVCKGSYYIYRDLTVQSAVRVRVEDLEKAGSHFQA
ncbi:hypothetical protein HPB47_017001 [Ixodes persulcatus]|uniref:Uncharacterized protein n=1 Tax=Ixodes persulcatus TaxID=34615 RepID=A0AC60QRV9_IXOPE|nr:hypothetical protein HPB47_017001 [Ixodes persulcatus]